jgi:hypothetical protein
VVDDSLDETLLLEVGDGPSGERAVDLHSVDEGGLGDDSVSGDLFDDSVATSGVGVSLHPNERRGVCSQGGLLEDDGVVGLVLHFSFRPFLLLTTGGC